MRRIVTYADESCPAGKRRERQTVEFTAQGLRHTTWRMTRLAIPDDRYNYNFSLPRSHALSIVLNASSCNSSQWRSSRKCRRAMTVRRRITISMSLSGNTQLGIIKQILFRRKRRVKLERKPYDYISVSFRRRLSCSSVGNFAVRN